MIIEQEETQLTRVEATETIITDEKMLIIGGSTLAVREYLDLDEQFNQIMFLHQAAIQQVTAQLNILKGEFEFRNDRNPIASISSRIKSKESIIAKMQRKGLPITFSAMIENIFDIAGMRITCPFLEDVYSVAKMLTYQPNLEIIKVKDYIREPKENGYRSLHVIVNVEVQFSNWSQRMPVEIQIRTIAMDFWASTEHQLKYKKEIEYSQEKLDKLKHCADLMAQADKEIQEIMGDFDLNQW